MNSDHWSILVNRVQVLNTKWLFWKQLYQDQDALCLLNETAPAFFGLVQESLLLDVYASIARLLDKTSTSGQENLVIESVLVDFAPGEPGQDIHSRLFSIKRCAESLKSIRHKVVAHEDMAVATGSIEIVPADCALMEKIIDQINALITQIGSALNEPLGKIGPVSTAGTGRTLLWMLEQSRDALRQARDGQNPDVDATELDVKQPMRISARLGL